MSTLTTALPVYAIYKQNAQSIGTTSQGFFPAATLLGNVTMYIESPGQIGVVQWNALYDKVNANISVNVINSNNLSYVQAGPNNLQVQVMFTDQFLTITYNNSGFCTVVSSGAAQTYNIVLYVQNLIGTTSTVLPLGGQLVNAAVAGTATVISGVTSIRGSLLGGLL